MRFPQKTLIKSRANGLSLYWFRHHETGRFIKLYICDICGFIYDPEIGDPDGGVTAGTPFEDIPEDWVCPECGASKDRFTKI